VALQGRGLPGQVLQAVPEVHRCVGQHTPFLGTPCGEANMMANMSGVGSREQC
jgi:hypothetical protein